MEQIDKNYELNNPIQFKWNEMVVLHGLNVWEIVGNQLNVADCCFTFAVHLL